MKDRVPNTTDNLQSRRTGGVKALDQCGQSLVNGKERRKVNVDMGLGQNRWHSIGQGKELGFRFRWVLPCSDGLFTG